MVKEFGEQGYCSFTLRISRFEGEASASNRSDGSASTSSVSVSKVEVTFVVQIRPEQHALDFTIAHAVSQTYGPYTPKVRKLDCNLPGRLQAFEMDMIPGIPLSRCHSRSTNPSPSSWTKQVNLVQSFATFIALAWPSPSNNAQTTRHSRADSPINEIPNLLSACTGNVGANIIPKLNKLSLRLPDDALRTRAAETRDKLLKVKNHPIVLNHGDLIASNMLVDEDTWQITGLVDWAEAEWLPFGTCLYGLEFLLGYIDATCTSTSDSASDSETTTGHKPVWRYYFDAPRLRELFWARLCDEAPGMKDRMEDVLLARDLGVLLWYGYAWDEGAIDRVVNEKADAVEVECLRTFLGVGKYAEVL